MRIEQIEAENVGTIASVKIDLRPWRGKIVSVWGDNGAGKTTFLEMIPGALWRDTPSQGSLANLAHEQPGFIEVHAVGERHYKIRQRIGLTQSSSVVADSTDVILSAGGVREYDRWAAKALLSPDLYFAGLFIAQSSAKYVTRRFIDMTAGERKAVILRASGVERLEALAEKARAHRRDADKALAEKMALVREVQAQKDAASGSAEQCEKLKTSIEELELARSQATARLQVAMQARDAMATAHAASEERALAAERAAKAIERLREEHTDLGTRLLNNEKLVQGADAIRSAASTHTELGQRIAATDQELTAATDTLGKEQADVLRLRGELTRATNDLERADGAIRRASAVLRDEQKVCTAKESIDRLRGDLEAWQARHAAAAKKIEALRRKSIYGAFDRIEELAEPLEVISVWRERQTPDECTVQHIETYARDALDRDTASADTNRKLSALLDEAQAELEAATVRVSEINGSMQQASRLAGQASAMEAARETRASAHEDRSAAIQARDALYGSILTAEGRVADASGNVERLSHSIASMREERRAIAKRASMVEQLVEADTRIRSYKDRMSAIVKEIEGHEQVPKAPDHCDLTKRLTQAGEKVRELDAEAQSSQRAVSSAQSDLKIAEHHAQYAEQLTQRLKVLEAEAATIRTDVRDWARLADDLGINGVQALEIDSAGPELTALTNELLHECYGLRWTASIETTKAVDKGRKWAEGCFVRVLDTEKGRDAMIETYSGGEKVLIGEAISLALTVLACRKAWIEEPTLIRDETAGALSEKNAIAYVAMLRHALRMTGAHALLFVSQSSEIAALADVRLEIQDGIVNTVDEEVTAS